MVMGTDSDSVAKSEAISGLLHSAVSNKRQISARYFVSPQHRHLLHPNKHYSLAVLCYHALTAIGQ